MRYGLFWSPPSYNYNIHQESASMDVERAPLLNEKTTVAQSTQDVRLAFVRKVYGLLTLQLMITVVVSLIMYLVEPIRLYVLQSPWFVPITSISSIIMIIFLFITREKYPLNLIMLFFFTVLMSFTIGLVVIVTDLDVIIKAVIATLITFSVLTMFTLQSRWDFSGMSPFLLTGLTLLVVTSFTSIFFPYSSGMQFGLGIIGTIIFCGYILFDTYNIFNTLSPDEYIIATINLYMDILNLFMSLVNILDAERR